MIAKHTDWVVYKQQIFISHDFKAGSPRSGSSPGQGRAFFQVADFLCPHVVEGARDLSGASFKGTDSIHEDSALGT